MLCLSYTLVYKINVYGGLVICRGQDEDAKEKKGSNNDAQEGWGCANAGALAQGRMKHNVRRFLHIGKHAHRVCARFADSPAQNLNEKGGRMSVRFHSCRADACG